MIGRRGPKQSCSRQLLSTSGAPLALVVLLVVLGAALISVEPVGCQEEEALSVESRQQKDSENELADTIKYLEKLEKLDKYWSEVARPRFGRSQYKQQSLMGSRLAPNEFPHRPMAGGASPLMELVRARLAQTYNSNY